MMPFLGPTLSLTDAKKGFGRAQGQYPVTARRIVPTCGRRAVAMPSESSAAIIVSFTTAGESLVDALLCGSILCRDNWSGAANETPARRR